MRGAGRLRGKCRAGQVSAVNGYHGRRTPEWERAPQQVEFHEMCTARLSNGSAYGTGRAGAAPACATGAAARSKRPVPTHPSRRP